MRMNNLLEIDEVLGEFGEIKIYLVKDNWFWWLTSSSSDDQVKPEALRVAAVKIASDLSSTGI